MTQGHFTEIAAAKEETTGLAYHFADFIRRHDPAASTIVSTLAVELVRASLNGHVCLGLGDFDSRAIVDGGAVPDEPALRSPVKAEKGHVGEVVNELLASKMVGVPGELKPIILDENNRLYLYRYWKYEDVLARSILARTRYTEKAGGGRLSQVLASLFPVNDEGKNDWQKIAVATAAMKQFSVISGGPGTGKTTTVVKLLALLLELAGNNDLHIALAAPTGKAAARLKESIKGAKNSLDLSASLVGKIPEEVQTLHRLLGYRHNSPYFYHDAKNPLNLDVLIVDEASMVDLALMAKLVDALPLNTKLVLLGDKDQLASVEAGRVLGDICQKEANFFTADFSDMLSRYNVVHREDVDIRSDATPLTDSIVILERSYRFSQKSGIGTLASAINTGNTNLTLHLLESESFADIATLSCHNEIALGRLADIVCQRYAPYLTSLNPQQAFQLYNEFRILCVHRHGSFGVSKVNSWVEARLEEKGLIDKKGTWYHGKPVMITANDYSLQLFNGDTGITMQDEMGRTRVFFVDQGGATRSFSPLRLPEHQTAFAMTVHKSQGSEFDHVILSMPEEPSPVVTRELLYTAVTRAKKSFTLLGGRDYLEEGILKKIKRASGFADMLKKLARSVI